MLRFSSYHTQILNELNKKEGKTYDSVVVIGAGQIRTGSLSMKAALTHLLQAKCFHNTDVLAGNQEDVDVCLKAVAGDMKPENWKTYLLSRNYAAALDFPINMFYKDVMKAFPDVKVILTTRDPKTWYSSVVRLFEFHGYQEECLLTWRAIVGALDGRNNTEKLFMNQSKANIWSFVPEGCDMSLEDAVRGGPDTAEKFLVDWEREVVRSVPKERLLVFKAQEGWKPLCDFLGVEQPDIPYPWLHQGNTLEDVKTKFRIVNKVVVFGIPMVIALLAGLIATKLTYSF